MKNWLLVFAATLTFSLMSFAQGGQVTPGTSASGGVPATTPQTADQPAQKHAKGKSVTGCLSGPNSEDVYELTTKKGKRIEVGAASGVDLKEHVGHEVKLTGTWEKSGAAVGETEKPGMKEKGQKHFKASNVQHISATCTPSSSGMMQKEQKQEGTMPSGTSGTTGGTEQPPK